MHHWLPIVVQKLQLAVGGTLTADLAARRAAFEHALASIPAPRTPIERQVLRAFLWEFAGRWAHRAHAIAHRSSLWSCAFRDQAAVLATFATSIDDPVGMCGGWLQIFFRDLLRAHPNLAVWHVAELLRAESHRALDITTLARRVEMSSWQLRRNFRAQFRMTMRDYHGRLRVLTALEAVVDGKSEATALDVGYRSRKNFYRQFRRCTGLTPTEFRRLATERRQHIANHLRRSLGDSPDSVFKI